MSGGACLFEASNAELYFAGGARELLEKRTGEAYLRNRNLNDLESRIYVRCITVGAKPMGAIGFEQLEDQ